MADSQELAKYLGVFAFATVKFLYAVLTGLGLGMNVLELLVTASLGAIVGVAVFSFCGIAIRTWLEQKFNLSSPSFKKRRRLYQIWHRYGLLGIALLQPLISPPVSVAVAIAFKEKKRRIILYMSVFIILWTLVFYVLKDQLLSKF